MGSWLWTRNYFSNFFGGVACELECKTGYVFVFFRRDLFKKVEKDLFGEWVKELVRKNEKSYFVFI